MFTYRGDFILSDDDKFVIKQLSGKTSHKSSIYNMERIINVVGLGEVLVKIQVDSVKGVYLSVSGDKIEEAAKLNFKKKHLYEIISVYFIKITVNSKEAELLLNVKTNKDDFVDVTGYYLEKLRIINYKVESSLTDDLLLYIQNLDFNYILNIIYGAYIVHSHKLLYPTSGISDIYEMAFIKKLDKIGFIIPEENPDTLKKVELIVSDIEDFKDIVPQDMAFLLINTLPYTSKFNPCVINNVDDLYSAILAVIQYNGGIEHL